MTALAPKARSNNRRELILDVSAQQFVEKGFASTSTRDIAKATGMLPGSLYYHFASKDDLLVAVFEEGVQRISASGRLRGAPGDAAGYKQLCPCRDQNVAVRFQRRGKDSGWLASAIRGAVHEALRCVAIAATDRPKRSAADADWRNESHASLVPRGSRYTSRTCP